MELESGIKFKYMDVLGLWSWLTDGPHLSKALLAFNVFYLLYQLAYLCLLQSVRLFMDSHGIEMTVEKVLTICIDFEPCFKILYILTKKKTLAKFIRVFRKDFLTCSKIRPQKAREIVQSAETVCNKLSLLVLTICVSTMVGYQLAPVAECVLSDCKYLKTIPDWHPFDESQQPAKLVTFLVDSGSLWFTGLSVTSFMILMIAVSTAVGAQIDVLADCLRHVRQVAQDRHVAVSRMRHRTPTKKLEQYAEEEEVGEDVRQHIGVIVKQCLKSHQEVLRMADLMENIFSTLYLFQMLTCTILICTCGFMLMIALTKSTTEELNANPVQSFIRINKHLCFFASMIVQLSVFSWAGFVVSDKTSNLQSVFYESDWSIMSQETKKNIIIAMTRANRPSKITAGKFYVVSLQSYSAIMRASYTYFTMLYRLLQQSDGE